LTKTRAKQTESRRRAARGGEKIFDGLGVSPGIAIGPAHVSESGTVDVPEYAIAKGKVAAERKRLAAAVELSRKQVKKLKAKAAVEEVGYLLDAYLQMLSNSRLVRGADRRIAEDRVNAEAAVQAEISELARGFAAMDDSYLAGRIRDVRDVGDRLVRNLTRKPYRAFSRLPEGAVIVADELSPADTALMDPAHVAGLATMLGGVEGHTAIMARALGLPAVLGVAGLVGAVEAGDTVIVDGTGGRVVANPTAATLTTYTARRAEIDRQRQHLSGLRKLAAVTRDGVEILLQANIELPVELRPAIKAGAQGVGLLRTEFIYMNRVSLPSEDEQYEVLADLVAGMDGRPVTVRTLDVGGDKLAYSLDHHLSDSVNPALGLRAIRLSLKERPLLEAQLAAMLRAGAHGPLRILLPMISNAGEIRQVREALHKVARRLTRRRVPIADPLPPLGIMIEVPAAALAADALARGCDFFAIGTNDLTMYTLAIDRGDEQVAHLYNPLHPAVLRLIQFSTEAALRAGVPVCLCGEMAGDPRYTALLLGLGIRDLSMSANALPLVKQRIRGLDLTAATQRARLIMDQTDSGHITALLDDFNALA
jgi:phosphotransferase system enzyme I (PtsI)